MEDQLQKDLYTYFGLSGFLPGQRGIIEDVLKGKDVLGILPTGSGKSLCYQLPAKILPGTTLVVSPLISLMHDQVKQLRASHFKQVIAVNSTMTKEERTRVYGQLDTYKLIYVSPEILQQEKMLQRLVQTNVHLFVIDEAHCISQWGHEFRPDYLRLRDVIRQLGNPGVLALSATATEEVQSDIQKILDRPFMQKHIHPVDRCNVVYNVKRTFGPVDKLNQITGLLRTFHVPCIIYFSSRRKAEEIHHQLRENISDLRISHYHGGMDQMDRTLVQQQFMNDQIDVICATSAFGMGIDKENIRLVIHYHMPGQMESFIQETGRAGRDGYTSISLLLYSEKDEAIPLRFMEQELPSEDKLKFFFRMIQAYGDKLGALPGTEAEILGNFGVSEVQWRLLNYHLEQYDVIDDKGTINPSADKKQVFGRLNQYIAERKTIKETKLGNMLQWIKSDGCLRKKLYEPFQRSYTQPEEFCCSNCGFAFADWTPKQELSRKDPSQTWQEQLRSIMLGDI